MIDRDSKEIRLLLYTARQAQLDSGSKYFLQENTFIIDDEDISEND
jgi:hypothetical protein